MVITIIALIILGALCAFSLGMLKAALSYIIDDTKLPKGIQLEELLDYDEVYKGIIISQINVVEDGSELLNGGDPSMLLDLSQYEEANIIGIQTFVREDELMEIAQAHPLVRQVFKDGIELDELTTPTILGEGTILRNGETGIWIFQPEV